MDIKTLKDKTHLVILLNFKFAKLHIAVPVLNVLVFLC